MGKIYAFPIIFRSVFKNVCGLIFSWKGGKGFILNSNGLKKSVKEKERGKEKTAVSRTLIQKFLAEMN
jgi:hypothetical protein